MEFYHFCGMDKKIEKSQLRRETMRRAIKWSVVAAVAVTVVTIAILNTRKSVRLQDIRVCEVERGALETTVNGTGRVVPAREEIVNSPVESRLLKVFVSPGDSVREGMPLIELDLESTENSYAKLLDELQIKERELTQLKLNNRTQLAELAMQIEVQDMQVNRLKVEVENECRLDSLGSGTGDRVRQAEIAYRTALLELQRLRARLDNERERAAAAESVQQLSVSSFEKDLNLMRRTLEMGRIPAPHDGVVTQITNEIGSRIGAGQQVAVVSDLSQFKIDGEVPEGSSDRVGIGASVTVRIGGSELTGRVSNITPMSKRGVVSFVVRLDDPSNSRLRSGVSSELYVSYGYKDDVVRIASGPYFSGPGIYEMWVMDGDELIKQKVRLGDSNRDYVEVLSGLNPGQTVVVSDMETYASSKKLSIKK